MAQFSKYFFVPLLSGTIVFNGAHSFRVAGMCGGGKRHCTEARRQSITVVRLGIDLGTAGGALRLRREQ